MLSATKHLGPRVRSFAALRMTNLQDDIMASRNLSLFIEILVNNRMAIAYKTKIGHAHLKVRDLQRSIDFYTRFLGLEVTEVVGNLYAFLTYTIMRLLCRMLDLMLHNLPQEGLDSTILPLRYQINVLSRSLTAHYMKQEFQL